MTELYKEFIQIQLGIYLVSFSYNRVLFYVLRVKVFYRNFNSLILINVLEKIVNTFRFTLYFISEYKKVYFVNFEFITILHN